MTSPVPDADAAEQQLPAAGGTPHEPPAVGDDVPEADAVEQALPAAPVAGAQPTGSTPLEADPADAAEQSAEVPLDDEEGRE